MKPLLVKIFLPHSQDLKDAKTRIKYGKLASIFGIVSNLIVSFIKLIIGAILGFIAFIADGLNNLSDAISSIVSFIGFKMSSKPADKDHPYGHARMEYLTGLVVASMVVALGIEMLFQAIQKMFVSNSFTLEYTYFVITCVLISFSILVKIYQCYFYRYISKTIHSLSLKASSLDSFCDVIASLSTLIGLIISYYLKLDLDAYFACAISVFILISGLKAMIEQASPLLGQKPSENQIDALLNLVKSYKDIQSMHDLFMHSYGEGKTFASLHVGMLTSLSLIEAHDIIDEIENRCLEEQNIHLVLHIDPIDSDDEGTLKIKNEIETILSSFDFPISYHDFHIKKGPTYIDIHFDLVISSEKEYDSKELIEEIQYKAKEYSPYYRLFINVDDAFSDFMYGKEEK